MKRISHIIAVLMLICVAFISCEREDMERPDEQNGRPIEFVVESEWPEMTKAAILEIEDVPAEGFRVWATWDQDPDDDTRYTNDTRQVYGPEGTQVTAYYIDDKLEQWICEQDGEWYRGYYNFAAALPATQFSGTHSSSFEKRETSGGTVLNYTNNLTLNFGNDGFHLGNNQADLMYAFHNEDNSAEASSVVALDFKHLFALLTIKISANSISTVPHLKKLTVYGIHSTLTQNLIIRQETAITGLGTGNKQIETRVTNNIESVLQSAHLSTENDCYWEKEYEDDDFNYGNVDLITPVKNLLVFPETLSSDCSLKIKIEYEENGETKTKTAEITEGEWTSGESYVYTFIAG